MVHRKPCFKNRPREERWQSSGSGLKLSRGNGHNSIFLALALYYEANPWLSLSLLLPIHTVFPFCRLLPMVYIPRWTPNLFL